MDIGGVPLFCWFEVGHAWVELERVLVSTQPMRHESTYLPRYEVFVE